jgi:NADH dehydrogenase
VLFLYRVLPSARPKTREIWPGAVVAALLISLVRGAPAAKGGSRCPAEFRTIDTTSAKILLFDAAPTILGPFPASLQRRALDDLRKLGVDVETSVRATHIDADGIEVVDARDVWRRVCSKTVMWAAGVQASPLAARLAAAAGAETDRAGRLLVATDCTVPGHPAVFAIGDMVSLPGVPGVAQPAIQQGAYVARVVGARLAAKPAPRPFHYKDKGSMAIVGRRHAVAQIGKVRLAGAPAFLVWGIVHLAFLVGWGNRFEAVTRWMWTLIARNRRERLISVVSLVRENTAREQLAETRPGLRHRSQRASGALHVRAWARSAQAPGRRGGASD